MDEVVGRSRVLSPDGSSPRLPVAHMVCNQMPPVGDKPSLMTFREVSYFPCTTTHNYITLKSTELDSISICTNMSFAF